MDIKLTKMKLWNRKHTKCASFKRTESEVKLGTLYFNNIKNTAGRYEVLFDINVTDKCIAGYKTHTR